MKQAAPIAIPAASSATMSHVGRSGRSRAARTARSTSDSCIVSPELLQVDDRRPGAKLAEHLIAARVVAHEARDSGLGIEEIPEVDRRGGAGRRARGHHVPILEGPGVAV